MDNNISYNKVDDQLYQDVRGYREVIRRLLWMSNMTRPDILYVVSIAVRDREEPSDCHWKLVKRIVIYLKGTRDLGIVHYKEATPLSIRNLDVVIWSDAHWAGDNIDRKSTSGSALTVNGRLVTWPSLKEPVVALSTMGAEFIVEAQATSE